jgi:hypothetical protein
MSAHLSPVNIHACTVPIPTLLRPTKVSTYFGVVGISQSVLPCIDETQELVTNIIQRRQLQRQALNIPDLYPDHPGLGPSLVLAGVIN